LIQYFNTKKVGDEVSLSVIRADETITVAVTLGEWPSELPSLQD
jgi:S1-C subfamily serine protease